MRDKDRIITTGDSQVFAILCEDFDALNGTVVFVFDEIDNICYPDVDPSEASSKALEMVGSVW